MDNYSSSDEFASRKENAEVSEIEVPTEQIADDMDESEGEAELEDTSEPEPIHSMANSPLTLRKRETTSGESMDDEDEENEENDDGADEIAESGVHDASFPNPLSSIDNLIHIGTEYQAVIEQNAANMERERDIPIWTIPDELNEDMLIEYIGEATGRYQLPIDRSLYLLQKAEYDYKLAINEVARRKEIRDVWSPEEISLFSTCFFHFGKRFKKIHAAMPQRSLSSIIQYYYNTKKVENYKTMINVHLNEADTYDELFEEINNLERVPAGYCENCNAKSDLLILNRVMSRHECKPCILYFRLMRVPRPASLRVLTRRRQRVLCPEYMKCYVNGYLQLMEPADGNGAVRLGIGKDKKEVEKDDVDDDDDDIMVVDECPLRQPSDPYIMETTEDEDPVDSNTCRMTREFESPSAIALIDNIKKKHHMCVPLVWRVKQTKCMEENVIINEEARQQMFKATMSSNASPASEVEKWKGEMKTLKGRMERFSPEPEIPSLNGNRSGKVRLSFGWSPDEKRDVVRCFHWYNNNFEVIAEIMGTKTVEQIKRFYEDNEQVILKSIEAYRAELRNKRNRMERMQHQQQQ